MDWTAATPIVSADDRPAWLEARRTRLTSTDIAKAMTPSGRAQVVTEKLYGGDRFDNIWFEHGRDREAAIARKAEQRYGVAPSRFLFDGNGFSATPDGIGYLVLGEYKTSTKPLPKTIPRQYRDQMYMAQYVMDAIGTWLGWEQHLNGVPVDLEPTFVFVPRNQARIRELLVEARELRAFIEQERLIVAY